MSLAISAIIITKNEEANLPDCLAALAWADEVLVVDSFSTGELTRIAAADGVWTPADRDLLAAGDPAATIANSEGPRHV